MKAFLGVLALILAATVHGLELGPGPTAAEADPSYVAGMDADFDDVTAKTITSTGTAPSLTATGAEFGSSITVRTAGGQSAALFSTAADDGQLRLCNRTRGPLCTFGGNGVYQFLIGNSGLFSIFGEGETFFAYDYPNVYFNGTGARVGIGTAAPGAKLDVVGDAQFGSGVSKTTVTATGVIKLGSSGYLDYTNSGTGAAGEYWTGVASDRFYSNIPTSKSYAWLINNGGNAMNFSDTGLYIGTNGAATERLEVTGGIGHYSRTIAELLAITPSQVGVSYFCNNCSPVKLVVSTGTSAGNFAAADGGAFQ